MKDNKIVVNVGRGCPAEEGFWAFDKQRGKEASNCWAKPNLHKRPRGFTLIELLVVVLIIGILAAVALPQYRKAVEKSRATEALTLLKALRDQQQLCLLEHGLDDETGACGQGDGTGNDLFSLANIEIDGEPDPDCSDPYCGPSTKDFSFTIDAWQVTAYRKPLLTSKYQLTFDPTNHSHGGEIWCSNEDENTNWCQVIGIDE